MGPTSKEQLSPTEIKSQTHHIMAKEIKAISGVKGSAGQVKNLPASPPLFRSLVQYDIVWVCPATAWKMFIPLWEVQEERKRDLRAKTTPEKAGEISEDGKSEEEDPEVCQGTAKGERVLHAQRNSTGKGWP